MPGGCHCGGRVEKDAGEFAPASFGFYKGTVFGKKIVKWAQVRVKRKKLFLKEENKVGSTEMKDPEFREKRGDFTKNKDLHTFNKTGVTDFILNLLY